MRILCALLLTVSAASGTSGHATSNGLLVKVLAEVEVRSNINGQETVKLAPADRVAPGDQVIYTLEIRNASSVAVPVPMVANPMPAHTVYVANSATGPGAEVSYSVDDGRTFDRPENLKVMDGGQYRPARAEDYTHIRWKLRHALKSKSVAYARFRAVVK